MITHKQAVDQGLFKDKVFVGLTTKERLHQGHINLITFAKTFGEVVVTLSDYRWFMGFCFYGKDKVPFEESKPSVELVTDLEALGVPVVLTTHSLTPHIIDLKEEERVALLDEATKAVEPYRNQLILPRKIRLCMVDYFRTRLFDSHSKKNKPSSSLFDSSTFVRGIDVNHFFLREVFKGTPFDTFGQGRLKLYTTIDKDPTTGFKYQSNTGLLTPEEKAQCLNKSYEIESKAIYQGGIFGKSKLECMYVAFPRPAPETEVLMEDLTYTETA